LDVGVDTCKNNKNTKRNAKNREGMHKSNPSTYGYPYPVEQKGIFELAAPEIDDKNSNDPRPRKLHKKQNK